MTSVSNQVKSGKEPGYIISKMSTVFCYPLEDSSEKDSTKIDKDVEKNVKAIIDKVKSSGQKFVDPDFGPTPDDELGAKSLYGLEPPTPAGAKYPDPASLKWVRPLYDDKNFHPPSAAPKKEGGGEEEEEEEVEEEEADGAEGEDIWCKHGSLFLGGTSSNDVVQGQLGDCWFLSALSVMGAHQDLLKKCFWRLDNFKEHGLFVCRFFKDSQVMYVVIDDRIPVKKKDNKVAFYRVELAISK